MPEVATASPAGDASGIETSKPNHRPFHILHVVRKGQATGGMENGVVNVTNGLPASQYRVSICALDAAETFSERIRRGDSQYFLLPKRGRGIDWALVRRLARLFREAEIDLVHSHNWGTFLYSVLAAKLTGVPIIHGEHGKNVNEVNGESAVKRWTKSLLGRRVDRIVSVSQTLAEEWRGYGVPQEKIEWIPNGVDVARFRVRQDKDEDKTECRKKFSLPESGLLVGSIGRLDELKQYGILLDAFGGLASRFPSAHLALLGEGPKKENLIRQAASLGIADKVSFLGHRSNPEDFLAALDIFALPSRFEGMSNVVLEAMATGLPVVCGYLPCHLEVFEPEREGILVNPCTGGAFVETLARLFSDPQRRKELGTAARQKTVERFSLERMIADYERLYRSFATKE